MQIHVYKCMIMFVSTTFEVIAEPARRQILDLLREGPRAVGELVRETGLSQPNTSRHLRVLREAGLVESTPAGARRVYRLRLGGLTEIESWLAPYRRMWDRSLADLERHLEQEE